MANFGGNHSRWLSTETSGNGVNGARPPKPQQPNIWRNNNTSSSTTNGSSTSSEKNTGKDLNDLFKQREGGGGMRVGKDFQAKVPPVSNKELALNDPERALLIWCPCPTTMLSESELQKYVQEARDKFKYNEEQASGLLFWHHYDIKKAMQDLGNFTPQPEEWSVEDKVIFDQAMQYHGKEFKKIKQMLPDKSVSSLICFYYNWKKSKAKPSSMDRKRILMAGSNNNTNSGNEAQKTGGENIAPGAGPGPSNRKQIRITAGASASCSMSQESDSDDDIINKQNGKNCGNCGIPCTLVYSKDNLCQTCHLYWKRTGDHRPLVGSLKRPGDKPLGLCRQKKEPPHGMFVNHDDLKLLASSPPQAKNVITQGLEHEILTSKYRVQQLKQQVEILHRKLPPPSQVEMFKPSKPETSSCPPKVTARWTQDEIHLAALAMRRYGKDYGKISKIIPTKTEAHLKSFYANYKNRYNLDNLVKEQELEIQSLTDIVPSCPAKRHKSS